MLPLIGIKNIVTQTHIQTSIVYSGKPHQSENELKTPYRVVSFLFGFPSRSKPKVLTREALFCNIKLCVLFYLILAEYLSVILKSWFIFFALLHTYVTQQCFVAGMSLLHGLWCYVYSVLWFWKINRDSAKVFWLPQLLKGSPNALRYRSYENSWSFFSRDH